MKNVKLLLPFAVIALSLCSQLSAIANVAGTEYWFAVPPNEYDGYHQARQLELYVSSEYDTDVTLEMPGIGLSYTKFVEAGKVVTFTTEDGTMNWGMEVRASEEITDKGIHLTSEMPISVNLLSARHYTSEGFQLLPVSRLGTEYRHVGYYDYFEGNQISARGGGFTIVAIEDGTSVTIALNGLGYGTTKAGKTIGQKFSVLLNKGQTYLVRGEGTDNGFDLTGSKVTSTKPVAFISSHMRTIVPKSIGYTSRDFLVEMLPPVNQWGQRFVVREFDREDRGDYFRLLANEDETQWQVTWFDLVSGEIIGTKSGELHAGEWFEYNETTPGPGVESIRGVSVWTASKPCGLMQYSYSAGWDSSHLFDPMMVWISSQEQAPSYITFQAPVNATFVNNYVNIIAVGDTTDNTQTLIKSVALDGEPLYELNPGFLQQRVPGTNYYHFSAKVGIGTHRLSSSTQLMGISYGFATWESYGWPIGSAGWNLTSTDEEDPLVTTQIRNGAVEVRASDDNGSAEFAGMYSLELLTALSDNVQLVGAPWLANRNIEAEGQIELVPVEPSEDMIIAVQAYDRAGNRTQIIDTVLHTELLQPALSINTSSLDEPELLIGAQVEQTVTVNSIGEVELVVDSITSLNQKTAFSSKIENVTVPVGESLTIDILYSGEANAEFAHSDSLLLHTNLPDGPIAISVASTVIPLELPKVVDIGEYELQDIGTGKLEFISVFTGDSNVRIDSIAYDENYLDVRSISIPALLPANEESAISFSLAESAVEAIQSNVEIYCSVDGMPYPRALQTNIVWSQVVGSVHDGVIEKASVQPQPSSSECTVVLDTEVSGEASINVYDFQGRVVLATSAQAHAGSIHLAHNLPQGVYTVRIIIKEQLHGAKLLVE